MAGIWVLGWTDAAHAQETGNGRVTFDSRSAIIDGKPMLILSGAIHYVRVPVSDWPRLFTMWVWLFCFFAPLVTGHVCSQFGLDALFCSTYSREWVAHVHVFLR